MIPVTWEAEAGESLELGGRGCSEPRSYHCTSSSEPQIETLSKKKERKKKAPKKYNTSHKSEPQCNFKFSSSHINEVPKSDINFNNIFHLN